MSATNRISSYSTRSSSPGRPRSPGKPKNSWSSMLDGVSSGKRLPEKSMLVLGGTPDSQTEFLDSLAKDDKGRRKPPDRDRKPPVANQFALGYTYQDVLDADQDDTLARLSLYLLTDPSPSFTPLLKPLLTPRARPHMLIVILLDWSQPWRWVRQLRDWVRFLRSLVVSLEDDCKYIMEENMTACQQRKFDGTPGTGVDADVSLAPGPGEWDEPLGLPLCVVCQNADKIDMLEREHGWQEDKFDFVLQYMRTILLKHGASLIYTMPTAPGSLQLLVHASLGIKSMLQKSSLKHNVIDRDRVLVPPNWDSWGKIRVLRDLFDAEGVSKAWSVDIQAPRSRGATHDDMANSEDAAENGVDYAHEIDKDEDSPAVLFYEGIIQNPSHDFLFARGLPGFMINGTSEIETKAQDSQAFLADQSMLLDRLRAEDEKSKNASAKERKVGPVTADSSAGSGIIEDHIGPVQFNMGGIQVDADDMLKRLKDREASREENGDSGLSEPADQNKSENERLANFFAGLMKKTTTIPRS